MKLVCSSGEIEACVGDRFTDHSGEWEVVAFKGDQMNYSPNALGGVPTVVVKPTSGKMPSWFEPYANDDGTIDWCGDSVAAQLLDKHDGRKRSARGSILTR